MTIADYVRSLERRAMDEAESFGVDTSSWTSLLGQTACYECGCIGCCSACPTKREDET